MPRTDPYNFDAVPDRPTEEINAVPLTRYSDEWVDAMALIRILLRQAIPVESINAILEREKITTVEQQAKANADLMTLAEQFSIPRVWLMKELSRKKWRKEESVKIFNEEFTQMTWLIKNADNGFGLDRNLPNKAQPDLKGPVDDKGPVGGKPPFGGAPKPAAPGAGGSGVSEVKSLLDRGDLAKALEALKKLVPEGGAPKPLAPAGPKPELPGKPSGLPGAGAPKLPAPAGPVGGDIKPMASAAYSCANCQTVLACGDCQGLLKCAACDQ